MIDANEREIRGAWRLKGGETEPDENCRRIARLTSEYLVRVASSPVWGDWETLYRDPLDGRYWERLFPQGEMQGGGPPSLRCLDEAAALRKYGIR